MKFVAYAAVAGSLASVAQGFAIPEDVYVDAAKAVARVKRALPNAPNGYTPTYVDCPSNNAPTIRQAAGLSPNETAWLRMRRSNTVQPMRDLLSRLNLTGFDVGAYLDRHGSNSTALPNIALAFSGGGWRALMNGAGAIQAFDSRTPNSTATGHLGGLLQSSTYIAGLSGGSWLVGSIYANNFSSVVSLEQETSGSVWEFGNSVFEGPSGKGIQIFDTAEYLNDIIDDVRNKSVAGFNTTLTDLWGRALSYQLINATDGGVNYTWSSVALTPGFQNASQPFPIIVADNRNPGQLIVANNASIFEFNPFEMGSWDPTYYGFMPTQYLGTNMSSGNVSEGDQCVVGYDNAGFIMGTSSTLFNEGLLNFNSTALEAGISKYIGTFLTNFSTSEKDIADYSPNPFFGWNPSTNPTAQATNLTLVDGGEDGQNIPLDPLIQPFRHIDVIFAVDSSADTQYSWPNGSALVATYNRSLSPIANGTGFPSVPDQNTMVNLGLNSRPTFFGCDTTKMIQGANVPLIVYLPNSPYNTYSNISTFQLQTNDTQRNAIIQNGANVATQGNGTFNSDWPTCVACAILSRSFTKTATIVPDVCNRCFAKYCWDGTLNTTTPANYAPTLRTQASVLTSGAESIHVFDQSWTAMTVAVMIMAIFLW